MLLWIIQTTVLSLLIIFLIHYLFNYFKTTLTVPKIKNIVNSQTQKYENMYNIISKEEIDTNTNMNTNTDTNINTNTNINTDTNTSINNLDTENMKDELKNFIKSQKDNYTMNISSTNISDLNTFYSEI
jgi:hypothetical protein